MVARGDGGCNPEFRTFVTRGEQDFAAAWFTRLAAMVARAGGHFSWHARVYWPGRLPDVQGPGVEPLA
eukprot:6257599-Lingulodinium_polyedra.AAC.1